MAQIDAVIAGVRVGDNSPVRLMGVVNVSPESFYKGSVKAGEGELIRTVEAFLKSNTDFLDIGGRSTAPYLKTDVPLEVELERVVWAVKLVRDVFGDKIPISVDTTRSRVAEEALRAGANIINDVSGLREDPRMAAVARDYGAPLIVVARVPSYRSGVSPIDQVIEAVKDSLSRAVDSGVDEKAIVVDPGIGFNRFQELPWYVWDSMVLAELEKMRALGRPILVGVSRKSFIGEVTGRRDPAERLYGSLGATAIAVYNGAHIVRTHDPAETLDVVKVASFIRRLKTQYTSW
ncbi:dihydropteroate synthase [Thermogladius sp.]|uniref:dihydropteroate synthase n=1 Tax=Thermogladius sp. TaxID=2023064 RepID=UPI003D1186A6